MKKMTFLQLSVLVVLIIVASACSKQAEYTNAIPADATTVLAVNWVSLADKAGAGDPENKEVLQKLTDALKNEMNAATFQQVEAILNNPGKAGIDLRAPFYFFNSPRFQAAMVAKVNSEEELAALLQLTEKEQVSTPVAEGDGYRFTTIGNQAMVAFTASTLFISNYNGNSQEEQLKKEIAAALKQTEAQSITANEGFKQLQQKSGDIALYFPLANLPQEYASAIEGQTPDGLDWKELTVLGSLSFEKGKIAMEVTWHTDNAELKEQLEAQSKNVMRPIQNTFLPYLPQSTLMLIGGGIDGEKTYEYLQANKAFQKNIDAAMFSKLAPLFSAFQNDIAFALTNVSMESAPSFLLYAEVKDRDILNQLYENKAELNLKRGEDILKLDENSYVYKSRPMSIFFGIQDNTLYATNNEQLYKSACQTVSPSAAETGYAPDIKGKSSAVVINMEAICALPIVKMMSQYGGQDAAIGLALCDRIAYLEATGGMQQTAYITLQLKDKESNALKQLVDFIKQYAMNL